MPTPRSLAVSVIKILAVIVLQVVYRVAYVIKSGFLIPSLFASQLNRFQHDDDKGPDIDYAIVCQLKAIYLVQSLVGSLWCSDALERLYARLLASHRAAPAPRSIEVLTPDQFTPDALKALIRHPRPVVIRGLAATTPAVATWTFSGLVRRYGSDDVLVTDVAKSAHRKGKLIEAATPGMYVANCEILFKNHPELRDDIKMELPLDAGTPLKSTSMQLFVGCRATGTPFHCANIWNLFVMVDGSKKWTLVDPKYTFFMYPRISKNMTYVSSYNMNHRAFEGSAYPLFQLCPRLEYLLEPGDVLLNPPWWWHAIDNVSDTTVAVATRWKTSAIQIYNTNVLFDLMQMINPTVANMMSLIIHKMIDEWLTGQRGSVIVIDDHTHFEKVSHDIELV